MKHLFLAAIFIFTFFLDVEAQKKFTESQAEKILEILSYTEIPNPDKEKNGIEFGRTRIPAQAGMNVIYRNIAIWNACKPNNEKLHIAIDTIHVRPIEGTNLYQLLVKGKSFPIKHINTVSSDEFEKRRKPIEYIIDLEHVFYIKSQNGHQYWYYVANDVGISINKCTKPWKYNSPPPPKIEKPEIVEIPDK